MGATMVVPHGGILNLFVPRAAPGSGGLGDHLPGSTWTGQRCPNGPSTGLMSTIGVLSSIDVLRHKPLATLRAE